MPVIISADSLAQAISTAPAWAIVSLTMPDEQMRATGAHELARWIVSQADEDLADPGQMALPF